MEALQFSQILADLSTLQSTVRPPLSRSVSSLPTSISRTGPSPSESGSGLSQSPPRTRPSIASSVSHLSPVQEPSAAANLLNANNTLTKNHLRKKSKGSILPEPPKFDKLGRRIIRGPMSGTSTPRAMPVLSRMGSGFSTYSSNAGSGSVTPNNKEGSAGPQDEDMARAKKLLELYQMRGAFQKMGDNGLSRSQSRVDKVVDVYTAKSVEEKERASRAKYT
ncbi:hypothetical protein HYALB_00004806 [Hymenoscyphus albidus]|uniref:Uncharacterized protein n=1 Tax=Hymenoscyphus albidus TaxID=595503 RepID=A0A9N9LN13_9HELO|nr:hypothetical protein HYALB_00004806 [Hymenoscyphus albidus]